MRSPSDPTACLDLLYSQVSETLGPGTCYFSAADAQMGGSFPWEMLEESNRALHLSPLPLSVVHSGQGIGRGWGGVQREHECEDNEFI